MKKKEKIIALVFIPFFILFLIVGYFTLQQRKIYRSKAEESILREGDDYVYNNEQAVEALQKWYNPNTGLWDTTGWWNSANALEAIENTIIASNGQEQEFINVIKTTYTRNVGSKFINNYYDDEGWWANALVRAHDITGSQRDLLTAKLIFNDMKNGWDSSCGGGIWWDKNKTHKSAISNELFLLLAIRLHQRTPSDRGSGSYIDWAQKEWEWFEKSGMVNQSTQLISGLDENCKNNGKTWTYNQGVIVGALVDFYKSTKDNKYLKKAEKVAEAAIKNLTDNNGILKEDCEPSGCGGGDIPSFKGIFIRYLAYLHDISPKPQYYEFIAKNARSNWSRNKNGNDEFGLVWSGPFDRADAARQSSAMFSINSIADPWTQGAKFARGSGHPSFKHSLGAPSGIIGWQCNPRICPKSGLMQWGPYVSYKALVGQHKVHFKLLVNSTNSRSESLVKLDVRENNTGTPLATKEVPWSSFKEAGKSQDFVLDFENRTYGNPMEFRVFWNNVPGAPTITIKDIIVDGVDENWTAANLDHNVGRLYGNFDWGADSMRDKRPGYLSKGTDTKLERGQYKVDFELKIDNFDLQDAKIANVSVVDLETGKAIGIKDVRVKDFPDILYKLFSVDFTVKNEADGHRFDFRLFWEADPQSPRLTQRAIYLRKK